MHALALNRTAFVGVARPGHPIVKRPSRQRFTAARHVIVSSDGQMPSLIDLVLRRQDIIRPVGVLVPSHTLAPGLVATSDLIGILPADFAAAHRTIACFKLPFELAGFDGGIVWHERSGAKDVAVCAVRDAVRDMVMGALKAR